MLTSTPDQRGIFSYSELRTNMFGKQLIKVGFLGLTLSVVWSGKISAQIDLSGQWANRLHEDVPSRGPGLEIGEWEGLPINNAARLKAENDGE